MQDPSFLPKRGRGRAGGRDEGGRARACAARVETAHARLTRAWDPRTRAFYVHAELYYLLAINNIIINMCDR